MARRPPLIMLVTALLVVAPLGALVLVFMLSGHSLRGVAPSITGSLVLLAGGAWISAAGVWRTRRWGFFALVLLGLGVFGSDLVYLVKYPKSFNGWYLVDFVCIIFGAVTVLPSKTRRLFFDASQRWWERAERLNVDLKGTYIMGGKVFPTQVLNMSETGCFARLTSPVKAGDVLSFVLPLVEFSYETQAEVVRTSQQPDGAGLRFLDSSTKSRAHLKRTIKDLRKTKPPELTI